MAGWAFVLLLATAWQERGSAARAETAATQPEPVKENALIEPPPQPSAVEILRELMKKKGARPVIMPVKPGTDPNQRLRRPASRPTVGMKREDRPLRTDGEMITDRVGRLVRRPNGWAFVFESEGEVLREPPMQLLPNRDLETMEIQSANGTRPVKFRVSGEVTEYRGANYLLLRKVLVVHDLGNLK